MRPYKVKIARDPGNKKMKAVFFNKKGDKIKTTRFGQKGASDYTQNKDPERKKHYLQRHSQEPGGVMTASTLSKEILWNKPSIKSSIANYKKKHHLK